MRKSWVDENVDVMRMPDQNPLLNYIRVIFDQWHVIYWNFIGLVQSSSSKVPLWNNCRNIEFHSSNLLDTQQLVMDIRIRLLGRLSHMPLPYWLKLLWQCQIMSPRTWSPGLDGHSGPSGVWTKRTRTEFLTVPETNFILSGFWLLENWDYSW